MDTQRTENLNLHHYYASWYAPGSLDYLLYSLRPPKDYRIGTVLLPDGRSAFRSLDFKMYIVGRQHQRADRRLAYFGRFRGDHTAYESAKALYYWYHG